MEIEVGEYVRTKKGRITKVKTVYSEEDRIKMKNFSVKKETLINGTIKIPDVVKHSFNIIDLIEVGDYVNGSPVIDVYEDHICVIDFGRSEDLYEDDINLIVTKEMMASMEYKVGEE